MNGNRGLGLSPTSKIPGPAGWAGSGICRKCGYTSYACYVTSFAPLVALLSENGIRKAGNLSKIFCSVVPPVAAGVQFWKFGSGWPENEKLVHSVFAAFLFPYMSNYNKQNIAENNRYCTNNRDGQYWIGIINYQYYNHDSPHSYQTRRKSTCHL